MKEEQLQMIAETLLPGFLPKDPAETELSFHFTLPPNNSYKVAYKRNSKMKWEFIKAEPIEF